MIRAEVLSTVYGSLPGTAGSAAVATAYLDTTRNVEDAAKAIELRWADQRRSLAEQGADPATLDAMAGAVGVHREPPGEQGQVLVGAGGAVRYDAVLPRPPARPVARCGRLPHLMPLVGQLRPLVPHVVALVDRTGGELIVYGPGAPEQRELSGRDYPVHKSGQGGWAAPRYEHRTEKTWAENARLVAGAVDSAVRRVGARLVVLSGEVTARSMVRDELAEPSRALVAEVEGDRRVTEGALLQRQIDRLVAEAAGREDAAAVARFEQERGQRDRAVQGLQPTVAALQLAQVETLLVAADGGAADGGAADGGGAEDPGAAEAWFGPEPAQLALDPDQLRDLGVSRPVADRLDAVLVRAAVGTGASIVPVPADRLDLADGVGALLRYPLR